MQMQEKRPVTADLRVFVPTAITAISIILAIAMTRAHVEAIGASMVLLMLVATQMLIAISLYQKQRQRTAISPVLATALLIAITLIAAIAVAGFVFGIFGTFTTTHTCATSPSQLLSPGSTLMHGTWPDGTNWIQRSTTGSGYYNATITATFHTPDGYLYELQPYYTVAACGAP